MKLTNKNMVETKAWNGNSNVSTDEHSHNICFRVEVVYLLLPLPPPPLPVPVPHQIWASLASTKTNTNNEALSVPRIYQKMKIIHDFQLIAIVNFRMTSQSFFSCLKSHLSSEVRPNFTLSEDKMENGQKMNLRKWSGLETSNLTRNLLKEKPNICVHFLCLAWEKRSTLWFSGTLFWCFAEH